MGLFRFLSYMFFWAISISGFARPMPAVPKNSSYEDVKVLLKTLEIQNPTTTKVFVLGKSDSGDDILGVQVGSGTVANLLVGTHHGNEYGATEVAKAFAADLSKNPIAGQAVFIIPVLNISGYNADARREIAKNTTFDPNRDYPGPCGTEGPYNLKSTAGLANFIEEKNIISSATLHTYSPAVLYPWGISTHDLETPYTDTFKTMGLNATKESGYAVGNSTELLYAADGTFEDFAFWKFGIWSMLFEMGYSHEPSDQDVKLMVERNVPGLRRMFTEAPKSRAPNHEFVGACDKRIRSLDRHDE